MISTISFFNTWLHRVHPSARRPSCSRAL